jgi:predicted permease
MPWPKHLFSRRRRYDELSETIREHLDEKIADLMDRGMTREEAERAARREFGNVTRIEERSREVWQWPTAESVWADMKFAARQLLKSPGFSTTAILTLALGIGANTAIFSMVRGVLLAPLPFRQPERLVMVWESRPNLKKLDVSYPDFQDWQRNAQFFERMAALTWSSYDLSSPGAPEHIDGMNVSSDFLATLGIQMALGHDFSPSEDQPHGQPSVIISDRLWKDRFGANPQVLGQYLRLGGADYTVIGVLPRGFRFWTDADVYMPLAASIPRLYGDRTMHGIASIARLRPGVSIAQAQNGLDTVQAQLDRLYPTADRNLGIYIDSVKEEFIGDTAGTLYVLLGAVTMVLLIACANVANLLFARSATREREFAIRTALGASRARVIRQLLTESVLLALTGGFIGLGVAKLALAVVLAYLGDSLPRSENVRLDLPVLCFAFLASIIVGILFGLMPALKSTTLSVLGSLKAGGRGSTRAQLRSQGFFVVIQMALTLVLLTGCTLLLRTVHELWNANPGFDAQNVLTFKVGLPPTVPQTAAGAQTAYQQLLDRVRSLPGVEAADVSELLPLSEDDNSGPFWIGTQAPASMQDAPHALYFWTGQDYLRTMRIPLLRGRFFTPSDTPQSERVIVVDERLAHTYFPDRDPVGQTITVAHFGSARIVGVVGHVKNWGMNDPGTYNPSQIYLCVYQLPNVLVPDLASYLTIIVRSPLDSATLMPEIRRVVYGTAEDQTIYKVRTMKELIFASMSSQRLAGVLLAAFAGLALLVASVGIYGVISYSVTQRTQEIGVRVALGATRGSILQLILAQGLRLAVAGLVSGIVVALVLGRILPSFSRLLYGVKATDPLSLLAVAGMLLSVSALACLLPAQRAVSVDPMQALRTE